MRNYLNPFNNGKTRGRFFDCIFDGQRAKAFTLFLFEKIGINFNLVAANYSPYFVQIPSHTFRVREFHTLFVTSIV
jgi:hypothetical protein